MTLEINNEVLTVLKFEEGFYSNPYPDNGAMSVGYGYNITAHGKRVEDYRNISEKQAENLLIEEVAKCISFCLEHVSDFKSMPMPRQIGFINMVFQIGQSGFLQFKNTLDATRRQNWLEVGLCLAKSKWYRQTPKRAQRVISAIKTGTWPDEWSNEIAKAERDMGTGTESARKITAKDIIDGFGNVDEVADAPIGQAKNPWGVGNPWDPATPMSGLPTVGTETDRKQPENGSGIDSTGLDKGTGTSGTNTEKIGGFIMNSGWASRKLWVTIGTMVSLVLVNVFGFDSEQVNTAVSAIISAIGAIYVIVQGIIDNKKQAVKLQDSKNAGVVG